MAGVTRGSEKFKGFFPATDETGGNKFLGKFMIELSRTIFFSQTPARISPAPVKLSSISLPSPYSSLLAPPCEIVRIKRTSVTSFPHNGLLINGTEGVRDEQSRSIRSYTARKLRNCCNFTRVSRVI